MYKRGPESICTPPSSEWTNVIAGNQAALMGCSHPLAVLRSRFRAELHEAALKFETELASLAKSVGIPWEIPVAGDAGAAARLGVVMSGHQPVIYHCGLAEKTKMLATTVRKTGLQGYNLIIDTDSGDAGELVFPTAGGILARLSISVGGELFADQSLRAHDELASSFTRIESELQSLNQLEAAKRVREGAGLYVRLANTKALYANSIVRRIWEGAPSYREVPLSVVSSLPSAREFITALVADAAQLHCVYNGALEAHRANNKIKNLANPFPNLKSDGMRYELPLWQVSDTQQLRQPYFSPTSHGDTVRPELLAPRGALITTMLRFLGADLFIHGLGGATYEPVTDLLLARYFALPETKFVAVSANRYLFSKEIDSYEEMLSWGETLRSIPTRIPQFLNRGLFTTAEEELLAGYHARRVELVAALQDGKEKRSDVRHIGVALKTLDAEIKEMLAVSSVANRATGPLRSPAELSQWYCRSFPYLLFEPYCT